MTPEITKPAPPAIETRRPPLPVIDPSFLPDTSQLVTESQEPLLPLDPSLLPDTSLLITEDGKPVDNIYAEKQQRLLTETLYCSWASPKGKPFLALANVGLFFAYKQPPLVPDVMLSLDVPAVEDRLTADNRSYFTWVVGKMPEVVIEIVSDRRGGEDTDKMQAYARLPILYYVIFDPNDCLRGGVFRAYELRGDRYKLIDPIDLAGVNLGLTLWTGEYEGYSEQWLRWCDPKGQVIPTGKERADQAQERADDEKRRADDEKRHADDEKCRADDEKRRADDEKRRADDEKQRAALAEDKMRRLADRLRELGEAVD